MLKWKQLDSGISGSGNFTGSLDISGSVSVYDLVVLGEVTGEFPVDVTDFLTNGVDNRIITATGPEGMNAEENLTFDGTDLIVTGNISSSGDLNVDGNVTVDAVLTATHIVETSSEIFKEDIVPFVNVLGKVMEIQPVSFRRKGHAREEIGFVAERVSEIYPQVVNYTSTNKPYGIEYSRVSAIAIQAIKELTEKLSNQEQQIQELMKKIEFMEKK